MNAKTTLMVLQELKELDLSTYPIDKIEKLIRQLKSFPLSVTNFHTGKVIYRVRPNETSDSYSLVNDLSYKPQEYNTTYQRASSPKKTMFYGSVIPAANEESEIDVGRVIAAAEGSKLFRKKSITHGKEVVTFGMWRLQGTVKLATILHPDIEKNISPFAIERAKELIAWLKLTPTKLDEATNILKFYSEEFSKRVEWGEPDHNYLHSAVATEFFEQTGLDGVLYPSSRVDGKGINVAICPEFVDANMRLEGVAECLIIKDEKKIGVEFLKLAWLNAGDTRFKWKVLNTLEDAAITLENQFKTMPNE
jgi:hypothetical protein